MDIRIAGNASKVDSTKKLRFTEADASPGFVGWGGASINREDSINETFF